MKKQLVLLCMLLLLMVFTGCVEQPVSSGLSAVLSNPASSGSINSSQAQTDKAVELTKDISIQFLQPNLLSVLSQTGSNAFTSETLWEQNDSSYYTAGESYHYQLYRKNLSTMQDVLLLTRTTKYMPSFITISDTEYIVHQLANDPYINKEPHFYEAMYFNTSTREQTNLKEKYALGGEFISVEQIHYDNGHLYLQLFDTEAMKKVGLVWVTPDENIHSVPNSTNVEHFTVDNGNFYYIMENSVYVMNETHLEPVKLLQLTCDDEGKLSWFEVNNNHLNVIMTLPDQHKTLCASVDLLNETLIYIYETEASNQVIPMEDGCYVENCIDSNTSGNVAWIGFEEIFLTTYNAAGEFIKQFPPFILGDPPTGVSYEVYGNTVYYLVINQNLETQNSNVRLEQLEAL